jgi:hypothetical protein
VVTFCALNNVEILLPQDSLDALVILIEETKETNSEEFIYKIAQVMFSDIKTS